MKRILFLQLILGIAVVQPFTGTEEDDQLRASLENLWDAFRNRGEKVNILEQRCDQLSRELKSSTNKIAFCEKEISSLKNQIVQPENQKAKVASTVRPSTFQNVGISDGTVSTLKSEIEKLKVLTNYLSSLTQQQGALLNLTVTSLQDEWSSSNKREASQCRQNIGRDTACYFSVIFGCYCFVKQKRTWTESAAFCRSNGMQLLSVETKAENDFIQRLAEAVLPTLSYDYSFYWTSGSDEEQENRWLWTATGQPVTYSNWRKNEPNGGTGENGLAIDYDGSSWFDVNKQAKHNAICEV